MIWKIQVFIWPPQIKEHLLQDLVSASSFKLNMKEEEKKKKEELFMWVDLSAPVLFFTSGKLDVFHRKKKKSQMSSQIQRLLLGVEYNCCIPLEDWN